MGEAPGGCNTDGESWRRHNGGDVMEEVSGVRRHICIYIHSHLFTHQLFTNTIIPLKALRARIVRAKNLLASSLATWTKRPAGHKHPMKKVKVGAKVADKVEADTKLAKDVLAVLLCLQLRSRGLLRLHGLQCYTGLALCCLQSHVVCLQSYRNTTLHSRATRMAAWGRRIRSNSVITGSTHLRRHRNGG